VNKKPYTFLLIFHRNLASAKDSGEKGCIEEKKTNSLSFLLNKIASSLKVNVADLFKDI
jgi:hypothetical protein